MNWKEILLGTLTGAIESVGESKLVDALQNLKTKHPETFEGQIKTLHGILVWIQPAIVESSNKIDDAFLNGFLEAVKTVAENNGIIL